MILPPITMWPDNSQVSTDLRSNWHVTWIDDEEILQYKFPSRAHAVEVINNILAGSITASQGPIHAKIAERRWIRSELVAEHCPVALLWHRALRLHSEALRWSS